MHLQYSLIIAFTLCSALFFTHAGSAQDQRQNGFKYHPEMCFHDGEKSVTEILEQLLPMIVREVIGAQEQMQCGKKEESARDPYIASVLSGLVPWGLQLVAVIIAWCWNKRHVRKEIEALEKQRVKLQDMCKENDKALEKLRAKKDLELEVLRNKKDGELDKLWRDREAMMRELMRELYSQQPSSPHDVKKHLACRNSIRTTIAI